MSRLPIVPDHRPYAELWIEWQSDATACANVMGQFLRMCMDNLNTWIKANKLSPEQMVTGIRVMNGAWLRFCKETDGYGPALPSRPGHVASPAEWTWMAIMAQQGPFTRGLLKLCHVRPEVIKFLADPMNAKMPPIYGKVEDHRIVEIEQESTPKPQPRRIRYANLRRNLHSRLRPSRPARPGLGIVWHSPSVMGLTMASALPTINSTPTAWRFNRESNHFSRLRIQSHPARV